MIIKFHLLIKDAFDIYITGLRFHRINEQTLIKVFMVGKRQRQQICICAQKVSII